MKSLINQLFFVLALSTLNLQLSTAFAQGTAFTYQGRLNDGGNPATGIYDLEFYLRDALTAGHAVGVTNTLPTVPVTNGLFIVPLDFGTGIFTGTNYWLEIGVRTNGSVTAYSILTPRQALTPVPYAIMANSASNLLGTVAASQLSGPVSSGSLSGIYGNAVTFNNSGNSYAGNGAGLTGVNAATVGGLGTGNFWQTGGNAGTTAGVNFVGTTDNQPLEFQVNGGRALRLEPGGSSAFLGIGVPAGAPNVIGGSPENFVTPGVVGAFIGGGGATNYGYFFYTNRIAADFGVIGGGRNNSIQTGAYDSTIGGGEANTIQPNAFGSTIGGGSANTIQPYADESMIGGGEFNTIETNTRASMIGGGSANTIQPYAAYSIIGGGGNNSIAGSYAAIPGGDFNAATNHAFAAGHRAKANHAGSFVWADDSAEADFADTANNQFLLRASGGVVMQTSSLRFPGAGADTSTPVFTHKATVANVSGNKTYINNPACNGQPNAILIITENWTASDNVGNSKVVGVYYDAGAGEWTIFVDDGSLMPVGVAYNVMVTLP